MCVDESCVAARPRFHPALWSGKRWLCCRSQLRSADGCERACAWSAAHEHTVAAPGAGATISLQLPAQQPLTAQTELAAQSPLRIGECLL